MRFFGNFKNYTKAAFIKNPEVAAHFFIKARSFGTLKIFKSS